MAENVEFEPSCWRYMRLRDLVDSLSEETKRRIEMENIDDQIILAQVIWSKKACELIHGPLGSHPPPYADQEGDAAIGSVSIPIDPDIKLLYTVQGEEAAATLLDTSEWPSSDDRDAQEKETEGADLVFRPEGWEAQTTREQEPEKRETGMLEVSEEEEEEEEMDDLEPVYQPVEGGA